MKPNTTRLVLGLALFAPSLACFGCGEPPAPAIAPDIGPVADAGPPPAVTASAVPEVFAQLDGRVDSAHISVSGPEFGPGLPGWARVSQLGDRGPWTRPRMIDGRLGSWLG